MKIDLGDSEKLLHEESIGVVEREEILLENFEDAILLEAQIIATHCRWVDQVNPVQTNEE